MHFMRHTRVAVAAAAAFGIGGVAQAGNGPGLGDPLPGPIVATAVRDRIPSFREPGTTYVLVFMDTSSASGRRAIPVMDRVARAHGRRAVVTSIHEDPAPTVREFADDPEWSPKLTFTVAADPTRNALQAVFGPNSWPQLPVAFVVRDGIVQWRGAPVDLEPVVEEVVAGRWDLGAAKRADEQRRLWDAELERIEAMAKSGRTDEALKALDTACQSAMPAQRSQCSGRKFQLLVDAGRVDEALAVGEEILRAPSNEKQSAGVAWSIANSIPGNPKALAFALRAAESSDRALGGKDPMVGAILARVQYLSGKQDQAAATARRALAQADTPELKKALEEDLRVYAPTPKGAGAAPPKAK